MAIILGGLLAFPIDATGSAESLRPASAGVSDDTTTWAKTGTASGCGAGASEFACLDDSPNDDSTYTQSGIPAMTGSLVGFKLTTGVPVSYAGVTLQVRYAKSAAAGQDVTLYMTIRDTGTTCSTGFVVTSTSVLTGSASFADFTYTLSPTEAHRVTDWSTLRVCLEARSSGAGASRGLLVSEIALILNAGGPAASFTYEPCVAGVACQFDGTDSVDAVAWKWSWDGGSTYTAYRTGPTIKHVFSTATSVTVYLKVKNEAGTESSAVGVTFDVLATAGAGGGANCSDPAASETDCPGGGTDESEVDCGAWWHLFCHVTSAIRDTFLPSTDLTDSWDGFTTTLDEHYPFGPATWAVGTLADALGQFSAGVSESTQDTECGLSATLDFNGDLEGGTVELPIIPGSGSEDSSCPVSDGGFIRDLQGPVRGVSGAVFVIGFALFMFKLMGKVTGGGGVGGEETS